MKTFHGGGPGDGCAGAVGKECLWWLPVWHARHRTVHWSETLSLRKEQEMTPDELREAARGSYPEEAATELLIRGFGGRFTGPGWSWMCLDENGAGWIDFALIPEHVGVLTAGEQCYLLVAASIASACPVVVGDCLAELDRDEVDLVLAALSHACGSHMPREVLTGLEARGGSGQQEPLHPWPSTPPTLTLIDGGA